MNISRARPRFGLALGTALLVLAASSPGVSDNASVQSKSLQENGENAAPAPAGAVFGDAPGFTLGYKDTPFLPGGKWRVHDAKRPAPPVVRPQTGVFTPPPSDAIILFDGADLSAWRLLKDGALNWAVEDGVLRVAPYVSDDQASDIETRRSFGDVQLHIEWRSPKMVESGSQGRGNSGVFLMGRYEIQILDSFENPTYADGYASAIYGWNPPLHNASLPPGEWQSFDIVFEAPLFGDAGLKSPAYVTVFHNGVLTQNRQEIPGEPTHRRMRPYARHDRQAPIRLQNHRNPVEFRNIWVRELDFSDADKGG